MFGEWTYEKPTEAGWYAVNRGDVVTNYLIGFHYFKQFDLMALESGLYAFESADAFAPSDTAPVEDWNNDFKFSRIDINELNKG